MPLTPLFTASQTIGLPNIITLTDTSTGSDVAITSRRVYLVNSAGEYVVPSGTTTDYIVWSYSDASISLDVLTQDTALNITVQWLNVGNTVLYTKTTLFCFTLYGEQFLFNLTEAEAAITNPSIIQDSDYLTNFFNLRLCIDNANQAVSIGGNIYVSQSQLSKEQYIINNQNLFF